MLGSLSLFQLVVLRILQYNVLHKILMKKAADAPGSQSERLVLFFLICSGVACFLWLGFGSRLELGAGALILGFGLLNAAACFAEWKAFSISLTLASVFTILDDIVAIAGGFLVFDEAEILDSGHDIVLLFCGTVLVFSAIFSLIFAASRVKDRGAVNAELSWREKLSVFSWLFGLRTAASSREPAFSRKQIVSLSKESLKILLIAVVIKSLIRGNIPLLLKYFSLSEGMNEFNFLLSWYIGSSVGAFVLTVYERKRTAKRSAAENIRVRPPGALLFLLSCSAWLGLAFTYHIYRTGAIVTVQPILAAAEAVLPIFVGLFFFSEVQQLKRLEAAGRWAIWACLGGTGMVIATFY